ncbi:MAG: hypothetical protein M3335_09210 [Actinomycetota bacterium]|nr:hypothetical protein [Actinomycetota bacterium]
MVLSRWRILALSAAALAALVLAAPAQAKMLKAIWGPTELPKSSPLCPVSDSPCSAFPVYRQLGVDVFQFQIHWDEVAPQPPANPRDPGDPAYNWGPVAKVVEAAVASGVRPAALVQRSPAWASGKGKPIWAPKKPGDFASFMFAASKRFPDIHMWMIWGEPSRRENFLPMKKGQALGPRIYAQMLDRSYAALKQADRRDLVIGGMTLNGGTVKPPEFIRLMKLPNGRPPRMDLWGHNPFDARFPRLRDEPIGRFRGFNDIDTLHREIGNAYRAGKRKVPRLWLSEWTIVSDRPLDLFSGFFVSRKEQAIRLRAAYTISRRTPYVAGLGWFTLLDQAVSEGGAAWGLMDEHGVPKPAFKAYEEVPSG